MIQIFYRDMPGWQGDEVSALLSDQAWHTQTPLFLNCMLFLNGIQQERQPQLYSPISEGEEIGPRGGGGGGERKKERRQK